MFTVFSDFSRVLRKKPMPKKQTSLKILLISFILLIGVAPFALSQPVTADNDNSYLSSQSLAKEASDQLIQPNDISVLLQAEPAITSTLKTADTTANQQSSPAVDESFSVIFASDPQYPWWRGNNDPACKNGEDEEDNPCLINKAKLTNKALVKAMNDITALATWPITMPRNSGAPVSVPQAVIMNGDLTSYFHQWQLEEYLKLYDDLKYPMYEGLGNHDIANNSKGGDSSCSGTWWAGDSKRCAKEALWFMAGRISDLPNIVNADMPSFVATQNVSTFPVMMVVSYTDLSGVRHKSAGAPIAVGPEQWGKAIIPAGGEDVVVDLSYTPLSICVPSSSWIPLPPICSPSPISQIPLAKVQASLGANCLLVTGVVSPNALKTACPSNAFPGDITGSFSYSYEIGNYHFVQLHNFPGFNRYLPNVLTPTEVFSFGLKNSYGITVTPSYKWLEADIREATADGKNIIINFHDLNQVPKDPSENDGKVDTDHVATLTKTTPDGAAFYNAIRGANVVAIVGGHIHQVVGRIQTYDNGARADIPVLQSGSAECQTFIYADLHEDYFNWSVVSSESSKKSFDGQPIWENDREWKCDKDIAGYDYAYKNTMLGTYIFNKPEPQVVTNNDNAGAGSLRHALAYGGKITFDPSLDGKIITLTAGQISIDAYETEIDASALPNGLTISGNEIYRLFEINAHSTVTMTNLHLTDGFAGGVGGAILNHGTLTILNSTISYSKAFAGGGGIANTGQLVMENCTVANNTAGGNQRGGGGILNQHAPGQPLFPSVTLRHCTIAHNKSDITSPYPSGGIDNFSGAGSLTVENSIIADNLGYNNQPADLFGGYWAKGTNIIEVTSQAERIGDGVVLTADPRLGPLGDYGGPQPTVALLERSPAINAAASSSLTKDQRGFDRPLFGKADLGAVEKLFIKQTPSFQQENVPVQGVVFDWDGPPAGATFKVYFDNGSGTLALEGSPQVSQWALGKTMVPNTTYLWRVDTVYKGKTYSGEPWPFTTRGALVVTTAADQNDGVGLNGTSLREAVAAALPGETITFADALSGQTIVLNAGGISIDKNLIIDASALAEAVTISGNSVLRVFIITNAQTVEFKNLTISDGNAAPGGGISNQGSSLTMRNITLTNNKSAGNGGAIYSWDGGSLLLIDSTLSDNGANAGGGIYFKGDAGGSITISGSTLFGNSAVKGGGIFIEGGADSSLIQNSTLTNNASLADEGGAIWVESTATLTLRHVTVVKNIGIAIVNNAPASLSLDNTIVATNFNVSNTEADLLGNYSAVGENLIKSIAGTRLNGTAPINLDPELMPLGFYGGSTQTMPPLPGSPVLDAGQSTGNTPDSDQRGGGYPRPNGSSPGIDLGAIESTLVANTDLKSFKTSAGLLSPAFLAGTTEYTVNAPNSTTSAAVKFDGTGGQTFKVRSNGGSFVALVENTASATFPLNLGVNTVEVEVTAQNNVTKKIYTLSIDRAVVTADLASLTTNSGGVSPAFDRATADYDLTVPNGTSTIRLTSTAADSQATILIADNFGAFSHTVASGALSPALPLNIGANRLNIKVTDREGKAVSVYTLTVNRQPAAAANADLSALTASGGLLMPLFNSGRTFYTLSVTDTVTSITVTPTTVRPSATIKVRANGGVFATVTSGNTSAAINLNGGDNRIEVQITAEDGTTIKSYILIVTQLVDTLDWASKAGDAASVNPAVSSDGLFLAFSSTSQNLVAGDTNNLSDVFVYDVTNKTLERILIDGGGDEGDGDSTNPSISADGRYVAFQSSSTNLVSGDTNNQDDIFVYDRQQNTIERVSLTDIKGQSNGASESPSISGDGRYVAFASNADNLVANFVDGEVDVYIYDRIGDELIGISVPFNIIANRDSLNPVISTDGNYVTFEYSVNKSIENGNPGYIYTDVYLYNRATLTLERVIEGNDGEDADGNRSESPSISADGRYVAFESNLNSLAFDDTNDNLDVFVYDRLSKLTKRVSVDGSGNEGSLESSNPAISGDGRFVIFESLVSTFVGSDSNGASDVFMKDLATGKVTLLSKNNASVQGDSASQTPAVSFDASTIAFESLATNLDPLDTNGTSDVYFIVSEGVASSSAADQNRRASAISTVAVADLSLLTTSIDPFSPSFSAGVNGYSVNVPNGTTTIVINGITAASKGTLQVRINAGSFSSVGSGENSSPLLLQVGANTIEIKVTAPNGNTTKTVTLTVTRAPSSNAKLSGLTLIDEVFILLTPDFSSGTLAYTADVTEFTTSITVIPVLSEPNGMIKVNGQVVASGGNSSPVSLNVGNNTITVRVTAEDGSTIKSYVVVVTRAPITNKAPVAESVTLQLPKDIHSLFQLSGFDNENDPLTYSIINQPLNGVLTGEAPIFFYTPNTGFDGEDSLTFKVNDGELDSTIGTISIVVVPDDSPTSTVIYLPIIIRN
jgi:Tol biopolymer transport system component/tRNA threonylcarbamoyladenosine modification (KEOPS) complex  Pcc1 subunit